MKTLLRTSRSQFAEIIKGTDWTNTLIGYLGAHIPVDRLDVHHYHQVAGCLECLLQYFALEDSTVCRDIGPEKLGRLTGLLVQFVSTLYKSATIPGRSDEFTFEKRGVYRLAVLSLRCISRCYLDAFSILDRETWNHAWLFDNDIDYLAHLLNDDEECIQKNGIGILGNFILMPQSYDALFAKIPHLISMAFSFAFDQDRETTLRKECLLLIKNFVVAFCFEDHQSTLPIYLEEATRGSDESIGKVIEMFESCGLFENLGALGASDEGDIVYRLALSELVLLLSLFIPDVIYEKVKAKDAWKSFERYLIDDEPTGECEPNHSDMVDKLRCRQRKVLHAESELQVFENIIQTLRHCSYNRPTAVSYFVNHTDLFTIVLNLIGREDTCSTSRPKLEFHAFHLLSEWLWLFSQTYPEALLGLFKIGSPGMKVFLWACEEMCSNVCYRDGALSLFVARVLCLHCSEILDLNLTDILGFSSGIGWRLTEALFDAFVNKFQTWDPVISESLTVCLQCLCSRFEFAKECLASGIV
ncbi:hypothetical protein HDU67_004517 [Dinochytrium kinnereticum]|nr:hypothetical protein HDU67_004517 [Dinochytrium kinnereticum]